MAMNIQIMNYDGLNFVDSQIGCELAGGLFIVAPECIDTLGNLIELVENEDIYTRPVRRRLIVMDITNKSLVPLLLNMDGVEERHRVFMLTIKLLAQLTQPVDCLLNQQTSMTVGSLNTEIETYIQRTQHLFATPDLNRVLLTEVLSIFQQQETGKAVPQTQSEVINYVVYLYRNLLFCVNKEYSNDSLPIHAEILRWMLEYNVKEFLMRIITGPQVDYWCVGVVQLLSLMFKDERSLDDEITSSTRVIFETLVNTSQNSMPNFSNSSEDQTCHSTSKDSESFSGQEVCGEGNSGSKIQEGQDGLKLYEEAKLQVALSEAATWQHVRDGMSDFCKQFLIKGFAPLLKSVKATVLGQNTDRSHLQSHYLFWLVQNFCRLLPVFEIPFDCVRDCFTVDTVGFLVYQAVSSLEQILIANHRQHDVAPLLKLNFLPLVGIHMIVNAVSYYWQTESAHQDYLLQLFNHLVSLKDLPLCLVMIMRLVDIDMLGRDYLHEAVLTTHKFILMADTVVQHGGLTNFDMLSYVKNFATCSVMKHYGQVLQEFESNSPLLNECVFTMMHHVIGDCHQPQTLLQLPILESFLKILDLPTTSATIPQEYGDLMQYALAEWLRSLDKDPVACISLLLSVDMETEPSDTAKPIAEKSCMEEQLLLSEPWTEEEENELCVVMAQCQVESVDNIVKGLGRKYIKKTPEEVAKELCRAGYWSIEKMMQELSLEPDDSSLVSPAPHNNTTQHIVEGLLKDVPPNWLQWLQSSLLDACFTIALPEKVQPKELVYKHCASLGHSMPLVPYTEDQENALANKHFRILLQSLEIELPEPHGVAYPRIPASWSPAEILAKAELLAPIHQDSMVLSQAVLSSCQLKMTKPFTHLDTSLSSTQIPKMPAINHNLWPYLVHTLNKANSDTQMMSQ